MKPARRAPDPEFDEVDVSAAPQTLNASSSGCSTRSLKSAVAVLSFLVVALAAVLGYVAYPKAGDAVPPPPSRAMEAAPSDTDLLATRLFFSAGEEDSKPDATPTYTHAPEISTGHVQRFDVAVSKDRNTGVTRLMDPDAPDQVQYESSFEILTGGVATLGEYDDQFGQVGDGVILSLIHI